MHKNKRQNWSDGCHHSRSSTRLMTRPEFDATGYYMWNMETGNAYWRESYGAAVCTSAAANKRFGAKVHSGVYFDRGRCFIMLDFVDEKFRHTR